MSRGHASVLFPLLLFLTSQLFPTAIIAQEKSTKATMEVTLSENNTALRRIFDTIKAQTNLRFFYSQNDLNDNELYTIHCKKEPVLTVINRLVGSKGFTCKLETGTIVIYKPLNRNADTKALAGTANPDKNIYRLHGQVLDSSGNPLPGASILIKGTNNRYTSKENGDFFLSTSDPHPVLRISYTGFNTADFIVSDPEKVISIILHRSTSPLDETVIIAYGSISRRLNTGNVVKVAALDIQNTPVSNPLLSLQGRIPGLTITQASGVPGSPLDIRLRVQNSFLSSNTPLIVVDGIPLPAGSQPLNLVSSHPNANVGLLSILNEADIESIDVLKDADATAIYGSRGGNGVILITTRKGTPGKTKVTADVTTGFSQVSRKLHMLNTQQYLAMRHEAFRNDRLVPNDTPGTPGYAPDILSWDTTRYTDWQDWQIGGSAPLARANVFASGGTKTTQMMLGLGYHREGSVYPSDMAYLRGTASFSLNHKSINQKFKFGLYANYGKDKNQMFNAHLSALFLPPNAPPMYDENGQLIWAEGNEPFRNPAAEFLKKYVLRKENQIFNLTGEYLFLSNTKIKINLGYNSSLSDENQRTPMASQNPYLTSNQTGISTFGNNDFRTYLIEPQTEHYHRIGEGLLTILAGASYQYTTNNTLYIIGSGYSNDALLGSLDGAATILNKLTNRIEYKYAAIFGRINYQLRNRYILNLSARRDGSSKFSPEHQFSNFGAVAAAWIFSEEPFIKHTLPFLSFGKLRSSLGVTGNDQIADYRFLDTWSTTLVDPYQGIPAMAPDALYNPSYSWERTQKFELALEIGLFKDRLLAMLTYFRNRSDNQLINYSLPAQTGFSSILRNFNALVQSGGWELTMSGDLIKTKSFIVNAALNISNPRNKLLRFDNLQISSYASRFVIGESLNVLYKLPSNGVSEENGHFLLNDTNGDGKYTVADYRVIGNLDPLFHGGFQLKLQYRRFNVSLSGDFRKQLTTSYLYSAYLNNYFPGLMVNQSDLVLDHWKQKGDVGKKYPVLSSKLTSPDYAAKNEILSSEEAYSDGSYVKFRNISVSYTISLSKQPKKRPVEMTVFCNAQNLFTITGYKGGDPETGSILSLPTLRTIAGGVRLIIQ